MTHAPKRAQLKQCCRESNRDIINNYTVAYNIVLENCGDAPLEIIQRLHSAIEYISLTDIATGTSSLN